ncbi:MAG: DinB family protein [Bacteroidia bacterium]
MSVIQSLLKEMEQEAQTTRKMLLRVPDDKYDWKPHPKSMNIRALATHIAELPAWVSLAINTSGLDFASEPYEPKMINTNADLIALFETSLAEAKADLKKTNEQELQKTWTLRNGAEIYNEATKAETIRHAYCQIVHHRAQMGVFLRLLDVAVPASYGPSADEH